MTLVNGVRIVENSNLWEVMTEYNAEKKFAIFLTNDEGEIGENQLPFMNVVLIACPYS